MNGYPFKVMMGNLSVQLCRLEIAKTKPLFKTANSKSWRRMNVHDTVPTLNLSVYLIVKRKTRWIDWPI
jgi:hypothetical protein